MLDKEKYPDILCANEEESERERRRFTPIPPSSRSTTPRIFSKPSRFRTSSRPNTPAARSFTFIWVRRWAIIGAVKWLVRKIVTRFRLPYFTLTPTFSVCPSHGYLKGEQERCSICDSETEVYSRVVGYLRPVKQWNDGKRAEFSRRRAFSIAEPAKGGEGLDRQEERRKAQSA